MRRTGSQFQSFNQLSDFLCRLLAFGNVPQDRPPKGGVSRLILRRTALDSDKAHSPGHFPKLHLAALTHLTLQDFLPMQAEDLLIFLCDELVQRLSNQYLSIDVEDGPCGQIGFHNLALSIQCEVAGRGIIVEVYIAIANCCEFPLGSLKLFIPCSQLYLKGLQFVHELVRVFCRHGGDVAARGLGAVFFLIADIS